MVQGEAICDRLSKKCMDSSCAGCLAELGTNVGQELVESVDIGEGIQKNLGRGGGFRSRTCDLRENVRHRKRLGKDLG